MTLLMGILNVTPDSFFKDSRFPIVESAIRRAFEMEAEGADILDIGGESTRPGSIAVDEEEELQRVLPVIKGLRKLSIAISIDTKKPAVAKAALSEGARLLNDVSGFKDPKMIEIAKEHDADICLMHMQGTPATMQQDPHYEEGVVPHLLNWFKVRTLHLIQSGIKKERIIIDPGIGFGKTVADNLEILHHLARFKELGFRVLLGISRKSFLKAILGRPTEELLPATLVLNALCLVAQVNIIRVHDVKEHRHVIDQIR